jgi:hypothetical protein
MLFLLSSTTTSLSITLKTISAFGGFGIEGEFGYLGEARVE